jgi:hypothetical protein
MMGRLCLAALLLAGPGIAQAQSPRGSFEVSGGVQWAGGYDAGSAAANETRNPATGSTPLTLFQTDSRVLNAPGVDVRAGIYITSKLLLSAVFQYSRPTLRTHVSADFEGAVDTNADATVSSYVIGGEAEYALTSHSWLPFVYGGAGQLREVPDGGEALTAAEIHAGGGVRRSLTGGRHPLGVRAAVAASFRSRSAGFDQKHHAVPTASAGLTWRF